MFSNSDEAGDVQRAYALGADLYLVKPREPGKFVEAVHDMEKHWLRLNATPECGDLADQGQLANCVVGTYFDFRFLLVLLVLLVGFRPSFRGRGEGSPSNPPLRSVRPVLP